MILYEKCDHCLVAFIDVSDIHEINGPVYLPVFDCEENFEADIDLFYKEVCKKDSFPRNVMDWLNHNHNWVTILEYCPCCGRKINRTSIKDKFLKVERKFLNGDK